jgi:23S rRNA (cytosine1962-C5)-methyltransferase
VDDVSPGLKGGEVVRVLDGRGYLLGRAFYSSSSKIRLRMLTRDDREIDRGFFLERLSRALDLRTRLFPGSSTYRLVHGEADLLPGLVVDRYGDHLVIQLLHQSSDARRALWVELLQELLKPACIIERSDVRIRSHEGLEMVKQVLAGTPTPGLEYQEGEVFLGVDLLEGQKTGSFLDQRENHILAGDYARGRCLDCFSYEGGFALQMARRGATVVAVESSEEACAKLKSNAERNKVQVDVRTANVFDLIRDLIDAGEQFETIVLDPPAFAKTKDAVEAATRGYKEINLRAMQLLQPGGILITCSCSHHLSESAFEEMLKSAAADAKRDVQVLERRGAGRDHPTLIALPETQYLKCYVLRVH